MTIYQSEEIPDRPPLHKWEPPRLWEPEDGEEIVVEYYINSTKDDSHRVMGRVDRSAFRGYIVHVDDKALRVANSDHYAVDEDSKGGPTKYYMSPVNTMARSPVSYCLVADNEEHARELAWKHLKTEFRPHQLSPAWGTVVKADITPIGRYSHIQRANSGTEWEVELFINVSTAPDSRWIKVIQAQRTYWTDECGFPELLK